jgi:hypothetical protein
VKRAPFFTRLTTSGNEARSILALMEVLIVLG